MALLWALMIVGLAAGAPWEPLLPRGACRTAEDCSLNGDCQAGACQCRSSWTGHNCQRLRLQPLPRTAGYGEAPNVTSWGGSLYWNSTTGQYHLFVTEETGGKGLASWATNSQIVHAVASTPEGPYTKQDVVSGPSISNPQVLYDQRSRTFLLFHIRGGGDFQLLTSRSHSGPWVPTKFGLGGCNNPTAAFHPNSSLFVMCHDSNFSLYRFDPAPGRAAWQSARAAPAIPTLQAGPNKNVVGNCEDPFIYFDSNGHFHALAHCYTCYWYPAAVRPGSSTGSCVPGSAFCAGHGFSITGEPGNWTWIGGQDQPYNFSSVDAHGRVREFSTRERPWALLEPGGDRFVALINGVSPASPGFAKFIPGRDWTYTNIQTIEH